MSKPVEYIKTSPVTITTALTVVLMWAASQAGVELSQVEAAAFAALLAWVVNTIQRAIKARRECKLRCIHGLLLLAKTVATS